VAPKTSLRLGPSPRTCAVWQSFFARSDACFEVEIGDVICLAAREDGPLEPFRKVVESDESDVIHYRAPESERGGAPCGSLAVSAWAELDARRSLRSKPEISRRRMKESAAETARLLTALDMCRAHER
jgi:hypothetical protein